jgi:hypothetical protein
VTRLILRAASRSQSLRFLWDLRPTPGHRENKGTLELLDESIRITDKRSSREQSQPSILSYPQDSVVEGAQPMNPSLLSLEAVTTALNKFGYDCAVYRRSKQDLFANGWSEEQVFGRYEMDVDSILLGYMDPLDAQPVSAWCSRTVNKLLPVAPLPVRLASTWLLTKLIRVGAAFTMRCHAANDLLVSHLALCREHERDSGMVDAASGEARNLAI